MYLSQLTDGMCDVTCAIHPHVWLNGLYQGVGPQKGWGRDGVKMVDRVCRDKCGCGVMYVCL